MDDLVEFLRARLDEDEQVARAAIADDGGQDGGFEDAHYLTNGIMLPRIAEAAAKLIRTFAVPRRVLAEVDAKRRIIDEYEAVHAMHNRFDVDDELERMGSVLRLLALPYADHPDYRQEWRM